MYKLPGLIFLVLLSFGCTNNANTVEEDLTLSIQEQIKGTWEVTYLKVEVDSYQNLDSNFVFEVSEENWERQYGVKPYRHFFAQDSTFRTARRNLDGVLMSEDKGLWRSFGDTLMLIQPNATPQYKVAIENGQAQWAGVVDWDYDGVMDDIYFATFRFVGKTSNE